jgi:DNA-binding beta-propeller fold protein YncE
MNRTAIILAFFSITALSANTEPILPFALSRTIPLPGVTGHFDHLAIDAAANRLFIASPGYHSVEVVDLKTDTLQQSISGLGKPHGLAWVAATGSLYISDGTLGELRVYKGTPLALAGKIKLSDDADDMAYDGASHLLFVGHGGSNVASPAKIAVVDTDHFILVANPAVAAHPEGINVDPEGARVFANVAGSNEVAVIGTATKAIAARWKLTKAADNVPLAFDSEHHLLYVACRTPGTLLALDAGTGVEVASEPTAGQVDDLFYDPALRRVYVISGAGEVDTFQVNNGTSLRPLGVLRTAVGAKTALFVPGQSLLYVGVPAVSGHSAEIRVYSTLKGGAN